MTPDKLLSAQGDELSRVLGEVLLGKHKYKEYTQMCEKCGHWLDKHESRDRNCTIQLTPAEAFKWRDWAVEKYGRLAYIKALLLTIHIDLELHEIDFTVVAAMFAMDLKPEHYLKAAALCVIKEQDNEK